ncbi:hypothetical protein JCM6882_001800 [Rhodosporidiobolus microsporus]
MSPYYLLAGGYDRRILTLAFEPEDGSLEIVATAECGAAPTWLTLSQDGKHVYSADEWAEPEGVLTALEVGEKGELKELSSVKSGGLWPCHSGLLTSTTPHQLLTTNYKGASLSSIPILPSGDLDTNPSSAQLLPYLGKGKLGSLAWRQEQAHPHGAHVDPRGEVCVIPDLGTDDLRVVGIEEDGKLEDVATVHLEDVDGPRHVLFAGKDRLYVLNELHNSITVFSVDYPSSFSSSSPYPAFTLLQSRVSLLPPSPMPHQSDFSTWHCAELVVTPDGRTLIASNRAEGHDPANGTRDGPADVLAIFAVMEDGTLDEASRKLVSAGGRAPRHMSLSSESVRLRGKGDAAVKEGKYLAVSHHDSDEVVIFERVGDEGRELKEVARKRDVGRPGIALWL